MIMYKSLHAELFYNLSVLPSADSFLSFFLTNTFMNTTRVSNCLDPDQTDILSVLIWVQTVCKVYQQTTKVDDSIERDNRNSQV